MEKVLTDLYVRFPLYLLMGFRMTGLFVMSPVFGRRNVPTGARIGLALLLTYILIPILPRIPSFELFNPYAFALSCVKEFLLGLTMGYITTLFFSILLTAGEYIDIQIGFGIATIFDPYTSVQMPLFGNFLNVLAMLIFFAVDGHHMLIRMLTSTFTKIPPGEIVVYPELGMLIVEFFTATFVLALQVALPVIAASLLAETALAIIMRAVPQMNVFVVGMPLKVILGVIVLIVILSPYRVFMGNVFDQMFAAMNKAFEGFAAR